VSRRAALAETAAEGDTSVRTPARHRRWRPPTHAPVVRVPPRLRSRADRPRL